MKSIRSFTPLQILVHVSALALLGWVVWELFFNLESINPIQSATQLAGKLALIFLVGSLACTPLNTVFGFRQALKVRRALGLYAFIFVAFHFLIFNWIDFGFDWSLLKREYLERRYVFIGLAAGTLLLALAATSFKWWMKRLGKKWKLLHRLVYLAAPLVILHYAWAQKGDIFRLQGDILGPLGFGIAVAVLLILRIPPVRGFFSNLRARSKFRLLPKSS